VVTSKHAQALFQVVATPSEFARLVRSRLILAQVAAHSTLDVFQRFAARLLIALFAVKFGFQLAKQSKLLRLSTVAKQLASKFLTLFAALYVSL
jgi:hypothetical protein